MKGARRLQAIRQFCFSAIACVEEFGFVARLREKIMSPTRSLHNLRTRSCIIDGEAVACDDNGLAVFDRIRYRRYDRKVFLYAFDLIEWDGRRLAARATRCPQGDAAVPADQERTRPAMERAHRGRRRVHLPPRLQARARRDSVEAEGLALPLRPLSRLA
jgi:hypothetical protein